MEIYIEPMEVDIEPIEVETEPTMNYQKSLNTVYFNPTFSEFGKQCDAILKTDDGHEFQVHSEVLSRQSEFFKVLFSHSEENGRSPVIHGIKPDTFEAILIYLCTGRVDVNPENMMDLLVASDFLMIESLKSECRRYVLQNTTIDNCLSLFLTANRIKGLNMEAQCRRFLEICFERVVENSADEASALPCDALKYFLSSRSLNVTSERTVWSLIEAWVQKDPSSRIQVAPELLRYVNINEIDDDLASELISSPIIRKNKFYEGLGDPNVTMAHLSDKSKAFVVMGYSGGPLIDGIRQPRSVNFITKVSSDNYGVEMFVTYDDDIDVWRKLGHVPCKPITLYRIGRMVYILDYVSVNEVQEAFTYDLLRGVTKPMTPPPLHFVFITQAAGHIYTLGDDSGIESGEIQEYVDETDEWVRITPMQPIIVQETVSLGGLLHVIGYKRDNLAMQVYDPSADRWNDLMPPRVRRFLTAAVEYRERLFLIGGAYHQGMGLSRDVEVYNPVRDEWAFYPELTVEYDAPVATVVKGRLFVYSLTGPSLVTYLDESSRQWRVIEDSSPLHLMFKYCFCLIEDEDLVGELVKKNKACDVSDWLQTGLENEIILKSSN